MENEEVKKLTELKRSIDSDMCVLSVLFDKKENLKPDWHVKALEFALKVRELLIDNRANFVSSGLVTLDLLDKKSDKLEDMTVELLKLSQRENSSNK